MAELHPDNVRRQVSHGSDSEGDEEDEGDSTATAALRRFSLGGTAVPEAQPAREHVYHVIDHRFYLPGSDHLAMWNSHPLVPHGCQMQPVDAPGEGEEDEGEGEGSDEEVGAGAEAASAREPAPLLGVPGLVSSSSRHSEGRHSPGPEAGSSLDDYGLGTLDGGLRTWDGGTWDLGSRTWDAGSRGHVRSDGSFAAPASPTSSQLSALRVGALRLLKAYVAVLDAAKLYASQWLRDTVSPRASLRCYQAVLRRFRALTGLFSS